eukprot:TRINITY_DN57487_c0_g1_i1.p1 TRINITY_DN57487_c0_g1~~TRINITY_DN57487_c0_g1_i1.p1  ORF type:complete len:549 (+),score=60.39 TRINITY_DN57487_c0_g1_i1:229-1647(+)
MYTGQVSVGGVSQKVLFDTGSFDFLVMSKCDSTGSVSSLELHADLLDPTPTPPPGWNSSECRAFRKQAENTAKDSANAQESASHSDSDTPPLLKCCSPQTCPHGTYNPVESSSFAADPNNSKLETMMFGSGMVIARSGFDDVRFVDSFSGSGLSNEHIPLKVMVNHGVPFLRMAGTLTAIMGIGPGPIEAAGNRWMNQLGIQRFMFCFSADRQRDGFVTWNDVDRSHDPAWASVPVDGKVHWALSSKSFSFVGPAAQSSFGLGCESGCGFLLDTGTTNIVVPKEMLDRITLELETRGVRDCSDLSLFPSLSLRLGTETLTLPPQSYLGVSGLMLASSLGRSVRGEMQMHTFPLTRHDAFIAQQATSKQDVQVATCMLLIQSPPCPMPPTQWGPLIIMGMSLFRAYAVQFDLTQEPQRYVRFATAGATCSGRVPGMNFLSSDSNALQKVSMDGEQLLPRILGEERSATGQILL